MRYLPCFLIAAFAIPHVASADGAIDPAIQGTWFCTSVNGHSSIEERQHILMLLENEFVVVTNLGVAKSSAITNENEIDILRYDGKDQRGILEHEGSTLRLALGNIGNKRPDHFSHDSNNKKKVVPLHSHYEFSRVPTTEGLKVLGRVLQNDLRREEVLSKAGKSESQNEF